MVFKLYLQTNALHLLHNVDQAENPPGGLHCFPCGAWKVHVAADVQDLACSTCTLFTRIVFRHESTVKLYER